MNSPRPRTFGAAAVLMGSTPPAMPYAPAMPNVEEPVQQAVPIESSGGLRWNIVVGVLGLLYAAGGLLMHLGALASTFFLEQMLAMGGMRDVVMPPVLRWAGAGQSCVLLVAGLLLGIGSALLIMRRPRGAAYMKAWVAIRIVMLVVGLVIGFALLKPNLDFQLSMAEAQARLLRERGTPEERIPKVDAAEAESQARIWMAAMTVIPAAFPLFVGLLLTSRKKKAEIESWNLLIR